jgi:hypothetical protein
LKDPFKLSWIKQMTDVLRTKRSILKNSPRRGGLFFKSKTRKDTIPTQWKMIRACSYRLKRGVPKTCKWQKTHVLKDLAQVTAV